MTSKSDRRSRGAGAVRELLLAQIAADSSDPVAAAVREFKITRQAVNAHLRHLTETGAIDAVGSTRGRRYRLRKRIWEATRQIGPDLQEDVIWEQEVRPFLKDLPENIRAICMYGFTEMVNNAGDHSRGQEVIMKVERDALNTRMVVLDDGVGIFRQIKDALHLEDERYAILELAKGKLTTDPARHTGEGIFFSSRAFDRFTILSGRLAFLHHANDRDWQIEDADDSPGTYVSMAIANSATHTMQELYDRFASADDQYKFSVTHVPVKLAQIGPDNLISRSQGKRLVSRFERFERVMLNFADVNEVGQAFADEVFRVFPLAHPGVELEYEGASPQVEQMIARAKAAMRETPSAERTAPDSK